MNIPSRGKDQIVFLITIALFWVKHTVFWNLNLDPGAPSPTTYDEPGSLLGLYTYRSSESCSVLPKAIHQASGTQDGNLGLSDLKPHAPDLFILEETEAPKS